MICICIDTSFVPFQWYLGSLYDHCFVAMAWRLKRHVTRKVWVVPAGPWGPAFVARQLQNLILMESFSTSLSEMVNIGETEVFLIRETSKKWKIWKFWMMIRMIINWGMMIINWGMLIGESYDLWWFPFMLTMVLNFMNPTNYPINKWPSFVGFYIPAPWWANMGLMLKNWGFSMPSFTCHWHIPVGFQRTRSPTNAPWLTTWNGPGVSKRSGAPACPGAWSDPWTTQTTFVIPLICLND